VAIAYAHTEQYYAAEWLKFTTKFNKNYAATEVADRYTIFRKNVDWIDEFNNRTDVTFTVGINQFADLTNVEFQRLYLGLRIPANKRASTPVVTPIAPMANPTSVDWVKQGAVTPVKDQGQCGSCWSFSTTGSVEGCHFLATKKLVSLSEQNLVDCSQAEGNQGCDGGLMDDAFQYIIDNKGIDTEKSYPYHATDGTCHYSKTTCGSTITAFTDVATGSEAALETAVASRPVSVAIDASQNSFQFYSSGVYYEPSCSSTQLDHGVLAAGYGTSGSTPYWLVKNSWGTSWGLKGYIWMSKNKNNNCGIATMASYPTGCADCTK
jgi:cathepsin L